MCKSFLCIYKEKLGTKVDNIHLILKKCIKDNYIKNIWKK